MQWLARWIARRIWWGSLWLMRRAWIRRLQSASFRWMSPPRAERARLNLVRQNVLARRIGLRMIHAIVLTLLLLLTIPLVFQGALGLVESGVLRPRSVR